MSPPLPRRSARNSDDAGAAARRIFRLLQNARSACGRVWRVAATVRRLRSRAGAVVGSAATTSGFKEGRGGLRDLVSNLNWFMNVPVEEDGALGIVDGMSAPGKRVAVRAEMDVLVLVSNCPQMNNPCNDFNPTPLRMLVVEP